ncbi:MAG: divalent cation tolerance protein CutA [Mariprofundus sp.]
MENNVCIILTSVAAEEDASSIAAQLVESGLAACVQISARGTSVYRWQGAIQKDEENQSHALQ